MTDRKLKFYLDGTLLETEPRGWDDINFFVKLDKKLNGLLTFIDADLEFFGDGYDMITTKLYDDGFCESMVLQIMESCQDQNFRIIHEGYIKLAKVVIDEKTCCARVKPDDNSFYAKIDKNRSLTAKPWVNQSKNGTSITPATLDKIRFFSPPTGTYYPVINTGALTYTCAGYRAYEVFKYFIAFMTDDAVEFDSTLLGTGGELEHLMVTTGTVMFTVQTGLNETGFKDTFPDLSFEQAYEQVSKKEYLGFYIDYSGAKPKMWIEKAKDIPTGVDIVTLDRVKQIKTSVDTDRLYNVVKFGSSTIQDVISLDFPESIDWRGFKEEAYNVLGDCGVDTELDLVSEWIISSNVIQDAIEGSNQYEGQFAMIECEAYSSGVFSAKKENTLTATPPYYYNQGLINSEVAKRYLGAVPVTIAKFLGNGTTGKFQASSTVPQSWTNPHIINFDDDFTSPNFDSGNNYNIANSHYICPSSGIYTFEATLTSYLTLGLFVLSVYDSTFTTLLQNIDFDFQPAISYVPVKRSVNVYLSAGQVVIFRHDGPQAFVAAGSTFGCVTSTTGGGTYQTYDPKDYLGLLHEFEYPINNSQWELIKNNPRGNIVFAQADQDFRRARIDTIRFNKTGPSQVKLIRSINL